MSWPEKLETLRRIAPTDPNLMLLFDIGAGASEEFLNSVRALAHYAPDSYIEFLRRTDGAQFDWFVFYGSGNSFPSLSDSVKRWLPTLDVADGLVIGEDSGGAVFAIEKGGRILQISADPPALEIRRPIADDFDECMDQVIMGPRYRTQFPFGLRDPDHWLDFLIEQGWASADRDEAGG
jgi:hypothetical protein